MRKRLERPPKGDAKALPKANPVCARLRKWFEPERSNPKILKPRLYDLFALE